MRGPGSKSAKHSNAQRRNRSFSSCATTAMFPAATRMPANSTMPTSSSHPCRRSLPKGRARRRTPDRPPTMTSPPTRRLAPGTPIRACHSRPIRRDWEGKPMPWPTPSPDEYNQLIYRIPRSPLLIIFRQGGQRVQTYQAEMEQKEGWFDAEGWQIDDPNDQQVQNWWFPDPSVKPGEQPRPLRVVVGQDRSSSLDAWTKARDLWKHHSDEYGMDLSPERLGRYRAARFGWLWRGPPARCDSRTGPGRAAKSIRSRFSTWSRIATSRTFHTSFPRPSPRPNRRPFRPARRSGKPSRPASWETRPMPPDCFSLG